MVIHSLSHGFPNLVVTAMQYNRLVNLKNKQSTMGFISGGRFESNASS